jgi:hypothetical protein
VCGDGARETDGICPGEAQAFADYAAEVRICDWGEIGGFSSFEGSAEPVITELALGQCSLRRLRWGSGGSTDI